MFNKSLLTSIPKSPGVYIFKDSTDNIIYIGKAKILKNRVRSYFNKIHNDTKTNVLVKKINNLDWIIVRDEVEAILTEANLIKKYRPRYNVLLKDDKSFPYIQITNEPYPQIVLIRNKNLKNDGSKYYGPYTDPKRLRQLLKTLHKIFPLRSCSFFINKESILNKKHQICLDYHINRCEGACEGLVSQNKYKKMINHAELFLKGRDNQIKAYLTSAMKSASDQLKYENAAKIRDQLNSINIFMKKQKKITQDGIDRDILITVSHSTIGIGVILKVRNGFFIGKEKFDLNLNLEIDQIEMTQEFLKQYYSSTQDFPKEILLEYNIPDSVYLTKWLQNIAKNKIKFKIPIRGEKRKLLNISKKNADLMLNEILIKKQKRRELLPSTITLLKEDLSMSIFPRRIEAFDNSNLQGEFPVAGMVVFIDGLPKKKEYRKYNIKTVNGINDFKSIYEVVFRRYSRQVNENKPLPDLILIDGGKGQLSSAKSALDHLGLSYITIIGLAKKLEEVYLPQFSEPQNISKTSTSLLLLRKIRDEVHRFAVTFHRQKKNKVQFESSLKSVSGMGVERIKKFWLIFNSLNEIKNLTINDLHTKSSFPKIVCKNLIEMVNNKYTINKTE